MNSGDRSDGKPMTLGRCGSYELLVELAAGGMATVYLGRARDGRDAPLVAIKRPHRHLARDKIYLSMLVDEARLASAIHHPNVVKVRELGFDAGEPFIVMDYVEGASVSEVRKELSALGRALDPRVVVRVALDALAGLQAAHVLRDEKGKHMGIVHRDVSPHNVLIGCDGVVRLTDFGIAKAQDRVQVTRTHEVKGKLAYLAPERIDRRRTCTAQSDVFSMAVVLWECAAGRRLFRGEEAIETLQEILSAPIPPLRKIGVPIPQALDDVILRGLSRDLDDRYESAAQFASALERAAGTQSIASPAEIAILVEALLGDRLRVRHDQLRYVLGGEDKAQHAIEVSGLMRRPVPTPEMRERERLAVENIAPPAPSARYVFGSGSEKLLRRHFATPAVRNIAIGGAALVGAVTIAGVLSSRGKAPEARVEAAAEPAFRRVVVTVPFPSTRITFDDQIRDLISPLDIASFDVPRESGTRHRVTAVGADGARAEGFAIEEGGIARPEGKGYAVEAFEAYDEDESDVIELPPDPGGRRRVWRPKAGAARKEPAVVASAPPPAPAAPKPVGTVNRDGFTRLR